jgi:hypothetical protein
MYPVPSPVAPFAAQRNPFIGLSGTDLRLLEVLTWLCRTAGKKLGRPIGRAYPSQAWLAAHVGACRSHVSERLQRLYRLGYIRVIRRRREEGVWKSNLYELVNRKAWRMARLSALFSSICNHVGSSRHKHSFGEKISGSESQKSTHGHLFRAIPWVPMTEEALEERRRVLRRQLEELRARGLA